MVPPRHDGWGRKSKLWSFGMWRKQWRQTFRDTRSCFFMRLFYLKKGGLGCLPTPITCISSSPALVPSHHLLLLSLLYPFPLGLSQSEHPSISQACLALEVFLKGWLRTSLWVSWKPQVPAWHFCVTYVICQIGISHSPRGHGIQIWAIILPTTKWVHEYQDWF